MNPVESPVVAESRSTAPCGDLPFTGPWLLAPMEGVTESCFRSLVLARNPLDLLGGAFTEFVRVTDRPVPLWVLRERLGSERFPQPVGIQLMGSHLDALAETARRVEESGAPVLDLNFGCPARGAVMGCAGSALLRDPRAVERVVRVCVEAAPGVPVAAKIRAGYDHADGVEDLARAAEQGGARLLTVHCRTRQEGYCDQVDWTRIARAVRAVTIPVCGNGGALRHEDLESMRRQTGCAMVMVGRGALADPWIFSGRRVARPEAALFLLEYARRLGDAVVGRPSTPTARVKQLLRTWTAGNLVGEDRDGWLRETDPGRFLDRLRAAAEDEHLPAPAAPAASRRSTPETPEGPGRAVGD